MPGPSRYRVANELSRGGMAEVLEAFVEGESGFERRVAIKRLLEEHAGDPSFLAGFLDEARIASQLHHANIVGVFDYGVMDDRPFIVMELVDGVDLLALESLAKAAGQKMTIAIALHVAVEIAHALHYAHNAKDARGRSMRIVHRDVSPENILVSWEGDIKLTDFGIARAKRRLEETAVGRTKGKHGYMAPEQIKGIDIDPRADLFSLGCVLHRMIAGKSPIDGAELFIEGSIPEDIRLIIEKATRAERAERYANAADMAEECGTAMARRLANDARTAMRQWIAPVRAHLERESAREEPAREKPGKRMADLFAMELIPGGTGMRRFASVAAPTPVPANKTSESVAGVLAALEAIDSKEELPPATKITDVTERADPEKDTVPPEVSTERAPVPEVEKFLIGAMVHGYQLIEVIAFGTGSRVYRAVHPVLGREVAVKVLPATSTEIDPAVGAKRLRREAQIAARLNHPNLVQILDYGTTPDGSTFMIMEHLAGLTLTEVIYGGEPLSTQRAANLAAQIARALAAAHEVGLVHRDLKTDNVIVLPGDRIKVVDFGLAREYLPDGVELTALTKSGMLLGTPAYMSPEQIQSPSTAGPKTDLYALGVILFEMLARKRPFEGHIVQVLSKHLRSPPPSLPSFGGIELLALQLMQKDPAARPDSAKEVEEELARLARGIDPVVSAAGERTALVDPTAILPPRVVQAAPMPVFVQVAIAGTALLVCVATGVYLANALRTPPELPPAPITAPPAVVPKPNVVAQPQPEPEPEPAPVIEKRKRAPVAPKPDLAAKIPAESEKPPAREVIDAHLKRVSNRIKRAEGTATQAELDAYETRFFELQARARGADTQAKLDALAKDLLAFERELGGGLE